jgi:hypothetical protein
VAGFVLDNSDETDALTDDAFYWIAPRRKIKRDNAAETHSPDKQIPAVRRGDREASSDNRRRRRLLIRFRKEADAEKEPGLPPQKPIQSLGSASRDQRCKTNGSPEPPIVKPQLSRAVIDSGLN